MYATDMMDPTENGDTANTPFYEKLVTEEVQELKAYSRMMEVQKQRVEEVEDLQKDLESRLQSETAARQKLETILALREREWSRRLESSEQDRQRLRQQIKEQEAKNQRISEIVLRKEQEIQRMVRRKVCCWKCIYVSRNMADIHSYSTTMEINGYGRRCGLLYNMLPIANSHPNAKHPRQLDRLMARKPFPVRLPLLKQRDRRERYEYAKPTICCSTFLECKRRPECLIYNTIHGHGHDDQRVGNACLPLYRRKTRWTPALHGSIHKILITWLITIRRR